MQFDKGDLVLISNGKQTSTCIILTDRYAVTSVLASSFYYSYCVETGLYGIVYDYDVVTVLQKNFAPDFPIDGGLFDLDAALYEEYFYYPFFYPFVDDPTDDSDGDDED